ncbi:MAG: hypothetical protein ACFFD4_23185 [Candidatus Odinarchaeota archaeon]
MSLMIRDYIQGDEEDQVVIFNTVMKELDPDTPLITPEKVRIRLNHPEFDPSQVKYLVTSEGKTVGYTECRVFANLYLLFYPLILKEYRTQENLDRLFLEIYRFAQHKNATIIEAHYSHRITAAHKYFAQQSVVDMKGKRETIGLRSNVDDLVITEEDFTARAFLIKDIESFIEFIESIDHLIGPKLSNKGVRQLFNNGEFSPEKTFLIEKNNRIRGLASYEIYPSENHLKLLKSKMAQIVYLRFLIIGRNDPAVFSIFKSMLVPGINYAKQNNVKELQIKILHGNPYKEEFLKLGFEENNRILGQVQYVFE